MKYALIALLFAGCSDAITVTPHQIEQCDQLGTLMKMKSHITRYGACRVISEEFGINENFQQVDGALQMLDFQQDLKIKPLQRNCYKKCASRIPTGLCDKKRNNEELQCIGFCHSAEGLDEFLQTGKTHGRRK